MRAVAIPGHQISVEDQRRLEVDGLQPAKIMEPVDAQDAARGLRLCDQVPAAVVIHGGGTQLRLGSPPSRYDVAFSTDRMRQLLEYEPADLTCRVQAGMPLVELQRALGEQGQRLPLDPPRPDRATVGGMVAANTSGLSRARYGTVRDWVIGIAVAYPSGKVARAGGKVVKNVAGYDLMKLHIGALGTLGVVAEVNLKVQAQPEAAATVLGHFESAAPAIGVATRLARQYLAPAAAVVLDRNALWACGLTADWSWTLALRHEGYRKEIAPAKDLAVAAIREAGGRVEGDDTPGRFWEAARDWSLPEETAVVLRALVPIAETARLADSLPRASQVMMQPAAGIAELRVGPQEAAAALRQLRAAVGSNGQAIVAFADAEAKKSLDVWGPPPPGFAIMRALKDALDPNGILNPGRYVGGI
jgi:glycolate oxidase FAD binding subunit